MPDMTTEEVRMLLRVQGLAPLDATDLDEITHRINAINEAVAALESADADSIEPLPVFWLTQEEGFEVPGYAGTTEEEHPHPNLLPEGRRDLPRPPRRQGCEVPACAGTTGATPPFTLILAFSPRGRRDLRILH